MAAKSLVNNALFNNAKVNDLTVDNLIVNNSEENKALDEINKSLENIDQLLTEGNKAIENGAEATKEVQETVDEILQKQNLENTNLTPYNLSFDNIDSQVNVYNTFKLNFSTLKMPRPFVDVSKYTPIGLLAFLNRWTALNSTADCFGILVAEYVLQKRVEVVPGIFGSSNIDPTATPELSVINPMSTTYDYYSVNTLKLFNLYDKILSYERLIGLTHDGFETSSKYNENTNTLELRIPTNVSKQFPADIASSLFRKERMNEIVNDYLRRVKNDGIYELTFDEVEFEKMRPVWNDLLTTVDNESGYSITVDGKTYPVVSSLIKYLFFVHSFLPIVAKQEIDVALKNNVAPGTYQCKSLIQGFNEWYSTMTLEKLSAIDLLLVPNLEANKTALLQPLGLLAVFNGNGGDVTAPYPFHYTALNTALTVLSVNIGNAIVMNSISQYCKDRVKNDYGIDFDDTNTVKQGQSTKTVINGKEYVMSTGYDITLTGEALKLEDSFKHTFEVVPATDKLDKLLPNFVKDLNTVKKAKVLRSEVSTMMSTMQLTNAYITGGYQSTGLYLLLSRQISTHSGAECPGILHGEVLLQKTFVLEDFESSNLNDTTGTDLDVYSTTFEQVKPSFSYFNKNLQELLNMMDKNLYAEKQIGVANTGVYAYSTFKDGVLTLAQDLYVRPQFVGGKSKSFMIEAVDNLEKGTKNILKDLALSTRAKLLYNQDVFAKEWPRFRELADKVQEACGATITVKNKTAGEVIVHKAPYITSVMKSLYLGHACTAMIAYKIQNKDPTLEYVKLTDKNPFYAALVQFGLLSEYYYWIPELDLFLNQFLGAGAWLNFYFTAFGTESYKKLKSEFGLEILPGPDGSPISFKNDFSEGYSVHVPKSSPAYHALKESFPEKVVY